MMKLVSFCRDCRFCICYSPTTGGISLVSCTLGKFTKKTTFDILDYIPEDFDCEDWEGNYYNLNIKWR